MIHNTLIVLLTLSLALATFTITLPLLTLILANLFEFRLENGKSLTELQRTFAPQTFVNTNHGNYTMTLIQMSFR